jgi:hypothetical protein
MAWWMDQVMTAVENDIVIAETLFRVRNLTGPADSAVRSEVSCTRGCGQLEAAPHLFFDPQDPLASISSRRNQRWG